MTSQPEYKPNTDILEKYAQVLIRYALNGGEGVKPGEVVMLAVPDIAKDLGHELYKEVLRAGAQPLYHMLPTGIDKDFYQLANKEQLAILLH